MALGTEKIAVMAASNTGGALWGSAAAWGGTFVGVASGSTSYDSSSPNGGYNWLQNSATQARNRSGGGAWVIALTASSTRWFGLMTTGISTGRPSPQFNGGQGISFRLRLSGGLYSIHGWPNSSTDIWISEPSDTVPTSYPLYIGISFEDPDNDYWGLWDASGNMVHQGTMPTTSTDYYPMSCTFDGPSVYFDVQPTVPTLGTTLGTYTAL